MYKPVGVKVKPVGMPLPDRYAQPRYFRTLKERDPYEIPFALPLAGISEGRVTEEHLALMSFGPHDFINQEEKRFLISILRMHHCALAFERGVRRAASLAHTHLTTRYP